VNPLATYLLWFARLPPGMQDQIAIFVIASAPHGVFDYRADDAPAEVLRSHLQRAAAELRFSAALYRMTVTGLALVVGTLTDAAFRGRSPAEQLVRDRMEIEAALGPKAVDLLSRADVDASEWSREYDKWTRFRRTDFSDDVITSWGWWHQGSPSAL